MPVVFIDPDGRFCQHMRLREHCEDCRFADAVARGYRPGHSPEGERMPEVEHADRDLLVETRPGTYTQIMRGDVIPHRLTGRPRFDRATGKPITGGDAKHGRQGKRKRTSEGDGPSLR